MEKSNNTPVNPDGVVYICGRCARVYYEYKHLVAHLYWRHGTESLCCKKCDLKRWEYAAHLCNVLPTDGAIEDSEADTSYCFCGQNEHSPMIACDSPDCVIEWYHFKCVGVVEPPDGDWFCPECRKLHAIKKKQSKDDGGQI